MAEQSVISCSHCGNLILSTATTCRYCGRATLPQSLPSHQALRSVRAERLRGADLRQVAGFIGVLFLIMGLFAPLISIPIVGTVSYFGLGMGDGWFILVASGLAFIFLLTRNFRLLWLPAILASVIAVWSYSNFQSILSRGRDESNTIAAALSSAIQMQWGWGLFLIGIILLATAATIKPA